MLLLAGFAAALPASASAIQISEFSTSSGLGAESPLGPLTAGADGNVWFIGLHSIGRITPSGVITEFKEGPEGLKSGSVPEDLTLGSDGNVWFTDNGTTKAIGKITPSGSISEISAGVSQTGAPSNIVEGGDGQIWFVNAASPEAIGHVTTGGTIEESPLQPQSQVEDITLGPDGNLWFTDKGIQSIGTITKEGGVITEFKIEGLPSAMPEEITAGADGNLWFSDEGKSAIGRINPTSHTIEEFTQNIQPGGQPTTLTPGPDGNIWFIDQLSSQRAVGRVTPSGTITEFTQGLGVGLPLDIVSAADGNLWVFQGEPSSIPGSTSLARVTTAGAITEFTSGLSPMGGQDGGGLIEGPDKSLWFTETGTPKAIGKLDLQLPSPTTASPTTTTASTTTTTGSPGPAAPRRTLLSLIRATFGNQQVALTTPLPTACTSAANTLKVTFSSSTISGSRATKLRFVRAGLFLDRGLARRRRVTTTSQGKKKTVTKTVYAANEILSRSPAIARLAVTGLKSGAHTLKVKIFFRQTVKLHGRAKTTTIAKTLTAPFRVC